MEEGGLVYPPDLCDSVPGRPTFLTKSQPALSQRTNPPGQNPPYADKEVHLREYRKGNDNEADRCELHSGLERLRSWQDMKTHTDEEYHAFLN